MTAKSPAKWGVRRTGDGLYYMHQPGAVLDPFSIRAEAAEFASREEAERWARVLFPNARNLEAVELD